MFPDISFLEISVFCYVRLTLGNFFSQIQANIETSTKSNEERKKDKRKKQTYKEQQTKRNWASDLGFGLEPD
jgi:hypothetical protein